MKKIKFLPANLLYNLCVCLFVLTLGCGVNPAVAAGVAVGSGVVLSVAKSYAPYMLYQGIQKEIWAKHIEEEIFPDNSMLTKSVDMSENVQGGKYVYIPQSGGSGNVVKNRTTFPATIRQRTDNIILYALGWFSSDPVVIRNAEAMQLSYDKRESVIGEDKIKLNNEIFEDMLYNWVSSPAYGSISASVLPSTRILETTGAATLATAPSATGNRKKFTLNDLQRCAQFLRKENRWFEGRMHISLPASAIMDMFPADSVITATYMQSVTEEERRAGIMFKAQGFNIWSRSSMYIVDDAGDIKAPGQAAEATDDEAALVWWEGAVERALGTVIMNETLSSPTEYGDVYSFEAHAGGRARRAGYEGVMLLKQAKTA